MQKDNKQLTDYIKACNDLDTERYGFNLSDEDMVEHVAYVFLTPCQIFKLWIFSLYEKYF